MRAHGFTDRPGADLDFATAMGTPLREVADGVAGAFLDAGLRASITDVTPRMARLMVEDMATGDSTCCVRRSSSVRSPAAGR
ncbi:hypothetical protein [Nonomuraea sp. B5E05]|uniref:hypothetical protein n=1 Tax=Nonomuraea sp. B5E05 TaxID=3153569 RepID=UPI003260B45B